MLKSKHKEAETIRSAEAVRARQLKCLPLLGFLLVLVACSARQEELFGEYEVEYNGSKATLSLKRDMRYEQVVLFKDGTRKVATGVWSFDKNIQHLDLRSAYYVGPYDDNTTLEFESLGVEKWFGRVEIVLYPSNDLYYEKVKSY